MITGKELAHAARTALNQYKDQRIPAESGGHSTSGFDCGGFVRYCFAQCGETFKLQGTNDLFRRPCSWRDTLESSRKNNMIFDGSLAFIVKNDGGERERGYSDGLGNSICVGIVSDNMIIYYSSSNEQIVETRINSTTRKDWWSHFMNINCIEY